jgi:L-ascorbate metabolism protein UlaG (beta-lactamase superfamily)
MEVLLMKNNPFLALGHLYAEPETQEIHQQMVRWMESTLDWVDGVLSRNPPAWPEPTIRRRALFVLDEPLHVLSAPIEPCLNQFLNNRIESAVLEIEREVVTSGVTIWKLYNHGFVVKTPELTIGFDLHQGPFESFRIESALFDRLLDATQALFISHAHSDHADTYAVQRMVAAGRPVMVPPRLWEEDTIYPQLIKPERHWKPENKLALGDTTLTYRVFPGHQGTALLNNVYLVELPQGIHVMQTGDQSNAEDFYVWIDQVHEQFKVDVLLPNCWSTHLPRLIQGVSPRLVITGHENEMSHPVDHREAFSKTYGHIAEEKTPVLVMAWGEQYHYEPAEDLTSVADEQGSAPGAAQDADLMKTQQYLSKF